MRIAVLGAGAIGGALAALLVRAGHEVDVTARGDNLAAIRSNGIRMAGAWGEYTAQVGAGQALTARPNLAIVATKASDAATAIAQNESMLRELPLVVVQNGLSGITTAKKAAPRADVIGALAVFAASYLEPGTVTVTSGGPIYLGTDGGYDIPARYAASVLEPVIETHLVADFAGAQWTKLVVNQINALPAITGMSAQDVVANAALRRVLAESIRENVKVARAKHITFAPLSGLDNRILSLVAAVPLGMAELLPRAMARRMGSTPNPGSTQQSIRRGQLTEIDYLNGAVVAAAEGTGVATPVNAALVEMVHEVENSGKFLSVEQVLARL